MALPNVSVPNYPKFFAFENNEPARCCRPARDACETIIQFVAFAALATLVVGIALTIAGGLVIGAASVGLLTAGTALIGMGIVPLIFTSLILAQY